MRSPAATNKANDLTHVTTSARLTPTICITTCEVLGGTFSLWIDYAFGHTFVPAPVSLAAASRVMGVPMCEFNLLRGGDFASLRNEALRVLRSRIRL